MSANQFFQSEQQLSLNQSFQQYQQSQPIKFPLTATQTLSFNNSSSDLVLTVEATEERVTILVEDRFDVNTWRGDFTSKYVEEITRKTGKERSYQTFIQMLIGTVKEEKGFSQFYLDILGFQDLQLLKAKKGDDPFQQQQQTKNNKKYLILTHVMNGQKVHYPLPLNPVETGAYMMDKETMQRMVKRMSQTLTEFKSMGVTGSSMGQSNGFGRQTAKEFFSKENIMHPAVEENQ